RVVVVDVGLCAIFGGFTVLATKALSTLLTKEWQRMFTEWITYPLLAVLLATGVFQIRYLNRALRRFDSKLVIPTQFVLFTLSAVIGSAVLYGDFRRATFHQMVTFLYGCGATFAGVFVIAWAPTNNEGGAGRGGIEGRTDDGAVISGNVAAGSVRSHHHPVLVMPKGARETPILRNKKSSLSLVGFSPSQNLLLVHTPPTRDRPDYWERDVESGSMGSTRGSR
ncbi:magnesium transporter NIPA-domain-containing protein, partial [Hygrophoropsis aurantiaca]